MADTNPQVQSLGGQNLAGVQAPTVDQSITQNQAPEQPLPRVNIDQPVTPGHDMVVNHIDGSQELAQGHVAAAIQVQETQTGEVVSKNDVVAGEAQENPRSPDPETNGPDQQVPGKKADEVVANGQPGVPLGTVKPAFPTPPKGQAPVQIGVTDGDSSTEATDNSQAVEQASAKAQPTSEDVEEV